MHASAGPLPPGFDQTHANLHRSGLDDNLIQDVLDAYLCYFFALIREVAQIPVSPYPLPLERSQNRPQKEEMLMQLVQQFEVGQGLLTTAKQVLMSSST